MASAYFQLQDFYTAGGGCDLGGAFLLARGLINRPGELTRLAGSFWGSSPYQAISVAKNRLDALVGIFGIGSGFTLAVVGYLASLATRHPLRTGTGEVLVGAALTCLALGLTVTSGLLYRRLRLLPLLIEMSRFTLNEERMQYPRAALLPSWLEALGHEAPRGRGRPRLRAPGREGCRPHRGRLRNGRVSLSADSPGIRATARRRTCRLIPAGCSTRAGTRNGLRSRRCVALALVQPAALVRRV